MMVVVVMGAEQVIHDVEEATIAVVLAVVVIMIVTVRRSHQMLLHGVPCRPDGLEGHEPHEEDQERTTHGAR